MPSKIPLRDTVGYMLAQVCRLHRQRADVLLNQIGLHVGQEMIMLGIWGNEGVTQTELAEMLQLQPATVTNTLRRLEREEIIERRGDLDDQRVSRVYATEKGRNLERLVNDKWSQLESEAFDGFSVEERVLLRRLLQQAHRNLTERE